MRRFLLMSLCFVSCCAYGAGPDDVPREQNEQETILPAEGFLLPEISEDPGFHRPLDELVGLWDGPPLDELVRLWDGPPLDELAPWEIDLPPRLDELRPQNDFPEGSETLDDNFDLDFTTVVPLILSPLPPAPVIPSLEPIAAHVYPVSSTQSAHVPPPPTTVMPIVQEEPLAQEKPPTKKRKRPTDEGDARKERRIEHAQDSAATSTLSDDDAEFWRQIAIDLYNKQLNHEIRKAIQREPKGPLQQKLKTLFLPVTEQNVNIEELKIGFASLSPRLTPTKRKNWDKRIESLSNLLTPDERLFQSPDYRLQIAKSTLRQFVQTRVRELSRKNASSLITHLTSLLPREGEISWSGVKKRFEGLKKHYPDLLPTRINTKAYWQKLIEKAAQLEERMLQESDLASQA